MRFVHVKPRVPQVGEVRRKEAFLFLPKRVVDETRFLERAIWEEKYLTLTSEEAEVWVPIAWVN